MRIDVAAIMTKQLEDLFADAACLVASTTSPDLMRESAELISFPQPVTAMKTRLATAE